MTDSSEKLPFNFRLRHYHLPGALALRGVFQDRLQRVVRLAGHEKGPENQEVALCRLVDEVGLHRQPRAVQGVLALAVEVKLQQVVALAVEGRVAAGRRVGLDGVAVVDDLGRQGLPGNLDLLRFGGVGALPGGPAWTVVSPEELSVARRQGQRA